MDDRLCRRFFLEPDLAFHRRYEALRAVFLEGRPLDEVAARYGYKRTSLKAMISTFRTQCRQGREPPFFFSTAAADPRVNNAAKSNTDPKSPPSRTSDS